jgi:Tfp pilus assembly protein PilN
VEVRGIALDNQTVADFMTRLEESPHFTDVRLQSTRRQAIGDLDNLKSFQITMRRLSLSEIARQEEEETEKGAKKS